MGGWPFLFGCQHKWRLLVETRPEAFFASSFAKENIRMCLLDWSMRSVSRLAG